jgi:hypothetical protein
MILRIIALDANEDEACQNLIDEYHEAGLLENCLSVDVSDSQNFRACFPDEEYTDLVTCLSRGLWTQIILVSLRRALNDEYPATSRVAAETELRDFLAKRYVKSTPVVSMTLSQIGTSVHESMFPQNFQAHFVHQKEIDVDDRLPRVDVSPANISQVLVFTALTISGAGKWVTKPVWHSIEDSSIGRNRQVRFVKVQTRIGVCGPLVADLVKAAVRPGGGSIPAGLPIGSFIALDVEDNELRKLSNSFIEKYRFKVMERALSDNEIDRDEVPIGPIKALLLFFKGFGRYLRSAALNEWQDRIEKLTGPLLKQLNDITFGDDSSVIIKGVRYEISSAALAIFAEELKGRLDGLDGVTAPKQTPEAWTGLLRTSFALLDGSDYPESTEESPEKIHVPSSSGKRIAFLQPNVVGPDLTDDLFSLTLGDCEVLELDDSRARSVSMFEHHEVERLTREVKEAVARAGHRKDVAELMREIRESEVDASMESKSRLRGTLSRSERIEAVRAESERDIDELRPARTVEKIRADLDAWLLKRETLSRDSFIAHLFESLDNAIEHEVSSLKWDALVKEIEELVKPAEAPKMRFKRLLKFFGFLLLPLIIVAIVVSSVLGAIVTVLGIPVLIFVAISWGTAFAFAVVINVLKRALALRRLDFLKKSQASKIEKQYRDLVHAINEFRRLQLLKVQFTDWQRLTREVVHYPYGRIDEIGEAIELIDTVAIPPQMVVAQLFPDASQATKLRNNAKEQLTGSGYLGSILVEMLNNWKEDYELIAELRHQSNPYLDVSPVKLEPGVVHAGRKYYFARRDFVDSSIDGNLRTSLVDEKVRSLSEKIFSDAIGEVFAKVNSGLNLAFSSESPSSFLVGLTQQNRLDFSTSYFDPEKLGKDGVEQIDMDVSFLSTEESSIKGFLVSGDEQQILLASTKVDISRPFSPDRLRMYTLPDPITHVIPRSSTDDPPV